MLLFNPDRIQGRQLFLSHTSQCFVLFFSPRRGAAPQCRPSSIGCRRNKLRLLLTRQTSSPLASRTSLTPTALETTEKSIQVTYQCTYFNMNAFHILLPQQHDVIERKLCWLYLLCPPLCSLLQLRTPSSLSPSCLR